MKILIVYSSTTGTTAECAEMLSEKLAPKHDVTRVNIESEAAPELSEYGMTVVGGSVRYGKFSKKMRKFLSDNREALEKGRTAYFLCCAYTERTDEYFEDMLTAEMRRNAVLTDCFGGTLKVERQKGFFMKLLVRAMRNEIIEHGESDDESATRILPEIVPTEINRAAERIMSKLREEK